MDIVYKRLNSSSESLQKKVIDEESYKKPDMTVMQMHDAVLEIHDIMYKAVDFKHGDKLLIRSKVKVGTSQHQIWVYGITHTNELEKTIKQLRTYNYKVYQYDKGTTLGIEATNKGTQSDIILQHKPYWAILEIIANSIISNVDSRDDKLTTSYKSVFCDLFNDWKFRYKMLSEAATKQQEGGGNSSDTTVKIHGKSYKIYVKVKRGGMYEYMTVKQAQKCLGRRSFFEHHQC